MTNSDQAVIVRRDDVRPSPLELAELLRQAERRAAMRRLASALAHAVGTPLNVIAGRAALISQAPAEKRSDHAANNAEIIERQVQGLVDRIQQMLKWLRSDAVAREPCSPSSLMETTISVYTPLAETRNVAVRLLPTNIASVTLPRQAVLLVLVDLLSLGLSVVAAGGRIEFDARCEHAEPPASERGRATAGKVARFRIRYVDTRVDEELFSSPYEPWNVPEGIDVDAAQLISVCFGVAREQGGWIEVEGNADTGTAIVCSWPCS
jgi:signal transduction histidine kinase